jgi:hypothetical protein
MLTKTTNDYTEYCTGCDFLCVLGAKKSLLTNKYHATVNHKSINNTVFETYEEAIADAKQRTQECVRYQR